MRSDQFLIRLYSGLGNLKHDFRNANLIRLVASHVCGRNVLDVGCGSGALPAFLRELGFNSRGIEPEGELVRLAKILHPHIPVVQGSIDDLADLGQRFDTVTSVDVVEHIENDIAALAAMRERLFPGGRLIVVVPAHPVLFGERDRLNGHFRRYTRGELTERLRIAGFHVEHIRSWNALGVLPYWYSERVRKRPLELKLRNADARSPLSRLLRAGLNGWLRLVENPVSFGFGLSLLAVATNPGDADRDIAPGRSLFRPEPRPDSLTDATRTGPPPRSVYQPDPLPSEFMRGRSGQEAIDCPVGSMTTQPRQNQQSSTTRWSLNCPE